MMTHVFLAAALSLALAGCATCYTKEHWASGEFEHDVAACEALAKEQGHTVFGRTSFVDECLKEKGWQPNRA